ncbi:hypothetical protein NESM_000532900 [Novymonas esmeraldas]|uniref:Uncharacterized protein n=1 Tax=Novymonas esmeraldas TaxID=1808958 RepID=A0AAW0ER45_9TRYP
MEDLFGSEDDFRRHPTLDVTSRAFQSKRYIQRVLATVSHAHFEGELVDKVGGAEEETGEALKQLIRDNLGVFINSKDAMDAVYSSDTELFTGEALDGITSSFKSASTSCEALVQPITATFLEVQKSRRSQDMLDKFFSVLGVPGAIYESCGAAVAQRRQSTAVAADDSSSSSTTSAADRDGERDGSAAPAAAARRNTANRRPSAQRTREADDDDDEQDEEDEDEDEEEEEQEQAEAGKPLGTLENPQGSTDPVDLYVLDATTHEIFWWHGTPLVRLKDVAARRHHVEQVSNFETAVLHLRRAMLYVEETYSLLDGTMLTGDDGTPPPASSAAAAGAAAGTASPVPGVSAVGRSAFAYKLAMALLRAALYLCSQLAEELVYANPADTVLIEDTLSMMMDASIASVKLHNFCAVLQEALGEGNRHGQTLTKLRTQLSSGGGGGGGGDGGDGSATAAAATPAAASFDEASPLGVCAGNSLSSSPNRSVVGPGGGGGGGGGTAAVAPAAVHAATFQHPAQFFISIVQRQQRHLLHSGAAGLLREASGWLWKAQRDAAQGLEERQRQQELRRKLRAAAAGGVDTGDLTATATLGGSFAYGRGLMSNSFLGASVGGEGGFIGNANDSFLQDGSFTWVHARGGTGQRPSSAAGSPTGSGAAAGLGVSGSSGRARGSGSVGGSPTEERRHSTYVIPDAYMTRVLDGFNTPETPFPTSTELRVGTVDMDAVLISSCLQMRMHSASLLSQLFTRADVEAAVMAQATSLTTFALRLCAECVGTLEHVVGSYWGGIAATLHAGAFDFAPEPGTPLHTILVRLLGNTASPATATAAGASGGGDGLQRSPSTILAGAHSRTASRPEQDGDSDSDAAEDKSVAAAAATAANRGATGDVRGRAARAGEGLPRPRFVPSLPHVLQPSTGAGAAPRQQQQQQQQQSSPRPTCLRDISVQAVHDMISTATATLQSLFIAFINRSVMEGFVGTLARYRVEDLGRYGRTERVELHAAVLYEIILGQWEQMMGVVGEAVLRLKIIIGESSSSATITTDAQVEEVGELLQDLELLRTTCLRCYLHGIGVLSKSYLTALPLLQRHTDGALDARVRSRLSRESVSSNAVHKLLNVLSVVMDRCVPLFTRDAEVFDSVDLFSVKSENLREDSGDDDGGVGGRGGGVGRSARDASARRRRLLRRRSGDDPAGTGGGGGGEFGGRSGRGSAAGAAATAAAASGDGGEDTVVDPISELIAQFHSKLVMESLQDHEELVLAMLSHLLLAFVDMLQLKCRTATTDVTLHPDERERSVVECMADTLCLATTLTPILMEHLLNPCFFEVIARQLPEVCPTPADTAALLQAKQQQYSQVYLSVVEEHCQLAVDAMMNTYLSLAQQPITDLVRRQGFVQPLFDWQRVSPHTTAAVRPYIADAIACIARTHETLNSIRQPVLGSAATQRLVAHLVRAFLTSLTSDVNVFELSVECSSTFLLYGMTLLEAEAITILRVVDAVVAHITANPTTSELLPELAIARQSLGALAQTLESYTNSVCEALAAARASEGGGGGGGRAVVATAMLSREKRHERRDGMVVTAMRTLAYMLEAINTELEESSLSSAALLQLRSAATKGGGGVPRSAVTERIVQRLERRKAGYDLRRARAAATAQEDRQRQASEAKKVSQQQNKRRSPSAAAAAAAAAAEVVVVDAAAPAAEADGDGTGGKRRLLRRRPDALQTPPSTGADADADGGEHLTPRTLLERDRESSQAAAAAGNVFQLAQDQQQKRKVRRVRKAPAAAGGVGGGADGDAESNTGAAPARSAAAAVAPTPVAPSAVIDTHAVNVDDDDGGDKGSDGGAGAVPARDRVPRRARRRPVNGDGDGDGGGDAAPERHERRANRFRRSNAL